MDLDVSQGDLVRALGHVQSISERRSSDPVLSQVLLEARDDELVLTTTDTEITGVSRIRARVHVPGVRLANASHFFQVAKHLPGGTVNLKGEDGNRLQVDAPPASFKLVGLPAEQFPPFPEFGSKSTLMISAPDLRRLIDCTAFAIPTDDQRYGLNGGHLESVESTEGEPRLRLVTTDGNRLCYAEAPYEGEFGMGKHMLLPRKALTELHKLLESSDQQAKVVFGDRAAMFELGSATLHTRLIDGEFPAYRSVLPKRWLRRVQVGRGQFNDALRRVALEASDKGSTVRMRFDPEEALLSARSVDQGEARHPVPISLEGEPVEMGFNIRFFMDVVGALQDEEIILELGEALSPCLVRVPERDDVLFIVMPIRLD